MKQFTEEELIAAYEQSKKDMKKAKMRKFTPEEIIRIHEKHKKDMKEKGRSTLNDLRMAAKCPDRDKYDKMIDEILSRQTPEQKRGWDIFGEILMEDLLPSK